MSVNILTVKMEINRPKSCNSLKNLISIFSIINRGKILYSNLTVVWIVKVDFQAAESSSMCKTAPNTKTHLSLVDFIPAI